MSSDSESSWPSLSGCGYASQDVAQGGGGQIPSRQSRLGLLQRLVRRADIRVWFSSAGPSTHLNRETPEFEAGLSGIHELGLRLIEKNRDAGIDEVAKEMKEVR